MNNLLCEICNHDQCPSPCMYDKQRSKISKNVNTHKRWTNRQCTCLLSLTIGVVCAADGIVHLQCNFQICFFLYARVFGTQFHMDAVPLCR